MAFVCCKQKAKFILISEGARNFNSADYIFCCNRFGFWMPCTKKKNTKFNTKFPPHACTKKFKPSKSSHCEVISGIVKVKTVSQHAVAGLGWQSSDVSLPSNKIWTESWNDLNGQVWFFFCFGGVEMGVYMYFVTGARPLTLLQMLRWEIYEREMWMLPSNRLPSCHAIQCGSRSRVKVAGNSFQ